MYWGKFQRNPDERPVPFSTESAIIAVKIDTKVLNWIQKHMIRDTKRPRDPDDDSSKND